MRVSHLLGDLELPSAIYAKNLSSFFAKKMIFSDLFFSIHFHGEGDFHTTNKVKLEPRGAGGKSFEPPWSAARLSSS